MKRLFMAAAALAALYALTSAAKATDPYTTRLQCTPPLDRRDPNPITRIYVSIEEHMGIDMSVVHEAANGEYYDRAEQYTDIKVSVKNGIKGWTGKWTKNPNHIMAGGVYLGPDGRFVYREKRWKNGFAEWDLVSPCVMVARFNQE